MIRFFYSNMNLYDGKAMLALYAHEGEMLLFIVAYSTK